MEDKYISAKWLREKFSRLADKKEAIASVDQNEYFLGKAHAYAIAVDSVDIAPVADVQPVKRGKWLDNKHTDTAVCSECGRCFTDETPYCPYCGAKMTDES